MLRTIRRAAAVRLRCCYLRLRRCRYCCVCWCSSCCCCCCCGQEACSAHSRPPSPGGGGGEGKVREGKEGKGGGEGKRKGRGQAQPSPAQPSPAPPSPAQPSPARPAATGPAESIVNYGTGELGDVYWRQLAPRGWRAGNLRVPAGTLHFTRRKACFFQAKKQNRRGPVGDVPRAR